MLRKVVGGAAVVELEAVGRLVAVPDLLGDRGNVAPEIRRHLR